jgi:hypothetical protein
MPIKFNIESFNYISQILLIWNPYKYFTKEYVYNYLWNVDIEKKINGKYSNLWVWLIWILLSSIEEKTYDEIIKEHVIWPLNMQSTITNIKSNKNIQWYYQYRQLWPITISTKSEASYFADWIEW